jgi:hypothetical protein
MSLAVQTNMIEAALAFLVLLLGASVLAIFRLPPEAAAAQAAGQEGPVKPTSASADPRPGFAPPQQLYQHSPDPLPVRRGQGKPSGQRYTPRHVRGHLPSA